MEKGIKEGLYAFTIVLILVVLSFNVSLVFAQVKTGELIDANNWQKAADLLPPPVIEMLKTHGLVIKVGESKDYPFPSEFVEATKKYAGTAKLEDNLLGYQAGLPFPEINPKDPNAGIKIAWNYQYHCEPEQRYFPKATFVWNNKNGAIERTATLADRKLLYVGRTMTPPIPELPNPDGIIYKELLQLYDPKDVAGIGFLQIRYKSEKKDDDTWAYVPALRRVRRMSAAQRTDAYIGTDIAIEDFYGFSGKITEFDWKFITRKKVLAIRDTERQPATFGGPKYKWCPLDMPWQAREVNIVEVISKLKSHPYSKRIIYLDAQWADCFYSEIYDKKGEFWKLWIQPWYWWPQHRLFTYPASDMIDFQALHATTVPTICEPKGTYGPDMFTIDALEKVGR